MRGLVVLRPLGAALGLRGRLPADQPDQELLQGGADQLLAAKRRGLPPLYLRGVWVAQGRGEGGGALRHHPAQERPFLRQKGGDPVAEEGHGRIDAVKAHHHQIRRHAGGGEGVKLPGGVENHLSLGQLPPLLPGGDLQGALVHIQKFPEVVAFPGEGVAAGVLKVVYGIEPADLQRTARRQRPVLRLLALIHSGPPSEPV